MEDLEQMAREMLATGATTDDMARELLTRTSYPIAVIKALREGAGLSLGEAKAVTHGNLGPDEREAAEQLWADLRAAAQGTAVRKSSS
jgi:ribosomal protein L7/L12